MNTVKDIHDLVARNKVSEASPSLRSHAMFLMDARESGSTTTIGLDEVPPETLVEEVKHVHVRYGCKCYRFTYPMGGRLGAIRFADAMKRHATVFFRNGKHGPELYVYGSDSELVDRDEDTIYVITGNHRCEDGTYEEAVFTWHPGEPMPTLDDGITDDTAVKVDT